MTIDRRDDDLMADLRRIFAEALGRDDAEAIGPDTLFFAEMGLASIDAVVLGEAIQAHYGQVLPFGDLMADLGTRRERDFRIGELATFLRGHLRG